MKIAITAQSESISSPLDPRFGRAMGFLVINTESGAQEYYDNTQHHNLAQGAGLQAAQTVAESGVQAVITGHVGPKAFSALQKGNIAVYYTQQLTVQEALTAFESGQLVRAESPAHPGQ